MIHCGIKVGAQDWSEKIQQKPDFVEVSFDNTHSFGNYTQLLESLNTLKIPFFVHLSTSFFEDDDEVLLNIASSQNSIRERSREKLDKEMAFFNVFNPVGHIAHTPTKRDFSRYKKIFGSTSTDQIYLDAINWVNDHLEYIMLETSTAAIRIDNDVFETLPFEQSRTINQNVPNVLDTAHLATQEAYQKNNLFIDSYDSFNGFSYYHIATLREYAPYDNHGIIFASREKEFPEIDLLDTLITKRMRESLKTKENVFFVCEPGGNTLIHIKNFEHLKRLRNKAIEGS